MEKVIEEGYIIEWAVGIGEPEENKYFFFRKLGD
jgi:hypothetical protein